MAVNKSGLSPLERDVVLRDGSTVHLRLLAEADLERLVDFYGRLSPESRYFRFLGARSPEGAGREELGRVSRGEELALAAELAGRLVAVASYTRPPGGNG